VRRYFIAELLVIGAVTAALLTLSPSHPFAAPLAVVVGWVALQIVSAFSFMRALYRGDVVEHKGSPRRYSVAPRATVSWYTRRFMALYLKTIPSALARSPTAQSPLP
jgi:hypothetical protein